MLIHYRAEKKEEMRLASCCRPTCRSSPDFFFFSKTIMTLERSVFVQIPSRTRGQGPAFHRISWFLRKQDSSQCLAKDFREVSSDWEDEAEMASESKRRLKEGRKFKSRSSALRYQTETPQMVCITVCLAVPGSCQ